MPKEVNLEQISRLRKETGLSFGEIKKALTEAGGDEEKAVSILREMGVQIAEKKSSRETKEGVVESYIHSTRKLGAMVELFCETDFVAKNDEFRQLAHDIAVHLAAMKPKTTEELLTQQFIKNPEITIKELIDSYISKLGENIQVGKFELLEI